MTQSFEEIVKIAKEKFIEIFGNAPEIACCAPGRVNLIGEHVDYNDGFVLPMALPMVTVMLGSKNDTKSTVDILTCCQGADNPKRIQFDTKNLQPGGKPKWANYVKGVIHNFDNPVPGFNAIIITNVPVGGGLSSSAALEVSTLTFLEQLTGKCVESEAAKALICQKAEHQYAGMPCGIMDQFISVAGKSSHALLIDCKSLDIIQIPFEIKQNLAVLICNSNVRHELSDSEYPTRRNQCIEALKLMGLQSYREATEDHLSALQCKTDDDTKEVYLKRARHVITEIKRTREAADALRMHDFEKMGKLMTNSHLSLRDDFQVSCKELDILVDSANNCFGVLGSRMTGGGFGGCTVTLLYQNCIDNVMKIMKKDFQKFYNNNCNVDFYVCEPSDGARVFNL